MGSANSTRSSGFSGYSVGFIGTSRIWFALSVYHFTKVKSRKTALIQGAFSATAEGKRHIDLRIIISDSARQ